MSNSLMHHGIKGQKWGIRRYQNPDGTYTSAGKARRGSKKHNSINEFYQSMKKDFNKLYDQKYKSLNKLESDQYSYADNYVKKRTGMSINDAYDTASKQNSDLDTGKLKYDDSLWKVINDAEDEAYDKFSEMKDKVHEQYIKDAYDVGSKFIESYLNQTGKDKILYKDLETIGEKYWNNEHSEFYSDYSIDELFNVIDNYKDSKYEYDFGEDIGIKRRNQ